jgi:hypothetical protein
LVGLGGLSEHLGHLHLVERGTESLEQGRVALLLLHLQRPVEQLPLLEVINHEIEQVRVLDPQARLGLGDVVPQEPDVFPDAKLLFGRVVGSSRGGAVAMNIDAGATPLVLLCPAWTNRR